MFDCGELTKKNETVYLITQNGFILLKIKEMKYKFGIGVLLWTGFAYDIENNKDFMTWIWLLTSLLFFVISYVQYKQDMKSKDE